MVRDSTLASIEFSKALLSRIGLSRVCTGCSNLKKLLLTCEHDAEVTNEDVCSLSKCPQLECLSLARWTNITDACITVLSSLCYLKEINLSYCSGVTSTGVQSLIRSNRNLEVIILSDRANYDYCKYCDDVLLKCIGECCPKLREFVVEINPVSTVVTEASFIFLFQGCSLIDDLMISFGKLSDAGLSVLATHCPYLKKLVLYDCIYTDVGLIAVSSNCTKLTSLALHGTANITDNSIISIAEHCNIEELYLFYTKAVTDRGLCLLFGACKGLKIVELHGLRLVTDRSILSLFHCCPKLKHLNLNDKKRLTEMAVLGLLGLEYSGGIEDLVFKYSSYLTDDLVAIVARNCSHLRMITIKFCPQITVKSLIALLTHSKRLIQVDILDCEVEVTQSIIDTYMIRRPSSRRININLGDFGSYVI